MRYRVVLVLLLSGLSASWASAQVPAGGEFRVNTYTTSSQASSQKVASDAEGNFVVVWAGNGEGDDYGVVARRYDASGGPRGSEFRVNAFTTGDQGRPDVTVGATGSFVVVWTSGGQDGSSTGVFAQRYDASGTPRGSEFQVNTFTTFGQWLPSVASDARGGFVVAWGGYGQDASGGVSAQRYDASGTPRGAEFKVNTFTSGSQQYPRVASDISGNVLVAWESYPGQDGSSYGIFAQRYDPAGVSLGAEFQVNTYTTYGQYGASASSDARGNSVVVWASAGQGGVFGQRYDASGNPLGSEFRVSTATTSGQSQGSVASDAAGNFVVAWASYNQDGSGRGVFARRYDASGMARGAEFPVNTYTTSNQVQPAVTSDAIGNFVVTWESYGQDGSYWGVFGQRFGGIVPAALAVDASGSGGSDGNRVLEPGETAVAVVPSWRNINGATQTFGGSGLSFSGPSATGVSYELPDAAAGYGTVANGATAPCSDCYQVGVTFGGTRPATHWDATFTERLTPDAMGQTKPWTLHVGESFTDVPKTSGYYRFVETLLHKKVTAGCSTNAYCPTNAVTREQMSVFVLVGKEGASYGPVACTTPVFPDVPASSPFCRWIEELSRRGVTSGCGGGNYCPTNPVTREQMSVFLLHTLDPALNPPACTAPLFPDVPASSPFCRWIEELARRGITSGCGGGNYCPTDAVTREQMAVLVSATFGLTLYGP